MKYDFFQFFYFSLLAITITLFLLGMYGGK